MCPRHNFGALAETFFLKHPQILLGPGEPRQTAAHRGRPRQTAADCGNHGRPRQTAAMIDGFWLRSALSLDPAESFEAGERLCKKFVHETLAQATA